MAQRAHKLLSRRLIHLAISEKANETAAQRRALGGWVIEKGEIRKLHLTAILSPEEVIMAEEKVDTGP